MVTTKEEEPVINFTCPFCNIDVLDDDDVSFDDTTFTFSHSACLKKYRDDKFGRNKDEEILDIVL